MDILSNELHSFLIRLGQKPDSASEKIEHYMKHLLRLLYPDEEKVLTEYYGLFGNDVKKLEDLARERGLGSEQLTLVIEASLRKIAVSPEWQMIKHLK